MNIGSWKFPTPAVFLAPMAGVTDLPFRQLCRSLGASMAISEMVTSKPELLHTKKLSHDSTIKVKKTCCGAYFRD